MNIATDQTSGSELQPRKSEYTCTSNYCQSLHIPMKPAITPLKPTLPH